MSQSYQIIARKYRPQTFSDVIGQEITVTTLKNAIRLKKSAHAYLFSGSRGTGKTTLARIFAKALNCSHLTDEGEPCNCCTSCQEISSSRSLDVIEIDGASNRGIDDIRHINETIGYAPSSGQYKIFIIDEVHMLTKEAFNALLKTLEEPPSTIKFFFATTEPHKLLTTIISRCQRFDLTRIPSHLIEKKLHAIVDDLQREVEPEALQLIAQFSEGSLRDAESFLDQVLCYEENKISAAVINQILGFLPKKTFFALDTAIKNNDMNKIFYLIDSLIQSGKSLSHFYEELITHFRYLLLAKMNAYITDLLEDTKKKYTQSAQNYTEEQLFYILDLLIKSHSYVLKSPFKRVTIEMVLMQIIKSRSMILLPTLIQRLVALEKNFTSSQPSSAPDKPPLTELVEVPFSLNNEKNSSSPEKRSVDHDTLMHFASVELEGSLIKKKNNNKG